MATRGRLGGCARGMRALRVSAVALIAGLAAGLAAAQDAPPAEDAAAREAEAVNSGLWVRTVQTADRKLRMEVACRLYERAAGGPKVMLAGAVHIADAPYYKKLQSILDANDAVLYEGVSPAGAEQFVPADEAGRTALTESRLRLLATMMHEAEAETGEFAPTIDGLEKQLTGRTRALGWVDVAEQDAWGQAIEIVRSPEGANVAFDLRSAGPNGTFEVRGDGDDLYFSDQPALTPEELGATPGIQQKLAKSLGLVFQLDEMNSDHAHWRNVDMSIAELNARFDDAGMGGEGEGFFAMLEGTGLPAKLLGLVLNIIEHLPGAQPRAKMMLMDMLTHADELMELAGVQGMDELMRVIIEDRNQVVIDELTRIVSRQGDMPDTIGIVYGAGHMPDLEERMSERLGYTRTKERWLTAIELDLDAAGITRMERAMLKRQLEAQLEMMRKQVEAQKARPV